MISPKQTNLKFWSSQTAQSLFFCECAMMRMWDRRPVRLGDLQTTGGTHTSRSNHSSWQALISQRMRKNTPLVSAPLSLHILSAWECVWVCWERLCARVCCVRTLCVFGSEKLISAQAASKWVREAVRKCEVCEISIGAAADTTQTVSTDTRALVGGCGRSDEDSGAPAVPSSRGLCLEAPGTLTSSPWLGDASCMFSLEEFLSVSIKKQKHAPTNCCFSLNIIDEKLRWT